jgi:hypothetical protein
MLTFDKYIYDIISSGHPFDVVSFDFKKAFDKAPHKSVIEALAGIGVCGKALAWFASFLEGRLQQVRVGSTYLATMCVTSGVVQGSVVGPVLYTVLTDNLLRSLHHPAVAFADDIKFVADVAVCSKDLVQADVNKVAFWSAEHHMPLSDDKSLVMHCGSHQPFNIYALHGKPLKIVDNFTDLGVQRSKNGSFSGHCQSLAARASKSAGAIRRAFRSTSRELLWPAFQCYIAPMLIYCSQSWNPSLRSDDNIIENVQRRFTKHLKGLQLLSYYDRLRELGVLSMHNRRIYTDMIFIYKILHGLVACPGSAFGVVVSGNRTRANGVGLQHFRSNSKSSSALFCVRSPSQWNKLYLHILLSVAPCLSLRTCYFVIF